jgi:AcrR family transcriptional regulator
MVQAADISALPLRERKKALIRESILTTAERLFEERGFDNVTVAEIADAANVSVKTLFVYFRSKEDLVFTDTWLIDLMLAAMRDRPAGTPRGLAVADAVMGAVRDGDQTVAEGIEGYHRGFGGSAALRSRLLRMWAGYEDQVTEFLAGEAGGPATAAMRLEAIQLVGLLRTMTSSEVHAMVAGLDDAQALEAVDSWLHAAAAVIDTAMC